MRILVEEKYKVNLRCVKLMTTKGKMTYQNSDAGVAYRPHIILNTKGLRNIVRQQMKIKKKKYKNVDEATVYYRANARLIIHELIHVALWMKGKEKSEGFIMNQERLCMKILLKRYKSFRLPYDRV